MDRRSDLRTDHDSLKRAHDSAESRFLPVWRSKNLILGARAASLSQPPPEAAKTSPIFLGAFQNHLYFAVQIPPDQEPGTDGGTYLSLRRAASTLTPEDASLLAYARAMVLWHERHLFCSRCSNPTRSEQGGHVLRCTNRECAHTQFPRLDPAIIVLVSNHGRCLLGRQPEWPKGVYSTIAGFVEPGESLEDAVAREVAEETGIRVDDVRYHSSQPWPFPSSLMLGFSARATTTTISRNDDELEDAGWFTREDIAAGRVTLPLRVSISYRLIEDWYDREASTPLSKSEKLKTRSP